MVEFVSVWGAKLMFAVSVGFGVCLYLSLIFGPPQKPGRRK